MAWSYGDQYSSAIIFTGTFALTYLIWNQFVKTKKNDNGKLPPSIGCLPILASLPYVPDVSTFHKFFLEKSYKIGDVASFQTWYNYIVILSSYDAIREAFVKQSVDSADRPVYYINEFLNPGHKGIIDSQYHSAFKKYHQLSLSILKEFGFGQSIMETRISVEVEDLIKSLRVLQGQPANPKNLVATSVLSVISSIALGDRLKDPEASLRVAEAVDEVFKHAREALLIDHIHSLRYLPKYRNLVGRVVSAQKIVLDLLEERIQQCLSSAINTDSFIASFIEHEGKDFDYTQLKYTLRDFVYAGFETSSTTLVWIMLMLANNQEIQRNLQRDIDSVVPRERLPSLEDKSKLPYLEAVILEVMRYKTLLPTGVPRATLNDMNVRGYHIPKGTILIANIYAAHMDKRTWNDPEIFKPERFLDATGKQIINKERVIPFSIGKRSCLGELLARQEIYLFITGLLQQFHIAPPEGVDHIEVEEIVGVTVAPSPFKLRFIPRS